MDASGREHAMDASGREHAMDASSREHAMNASSREHAMDASSREHAMDASSFYASSSLRFPGTSYGSLGRCQGFASPRKNRAPLTPPQPSTNSTEKKAKGRSSGEPEQPRLLPTGRAFHCPPKLETMTPADISLLRAKNGLDKGVHFKDHPDYANFNWRATLATLRQIGADRRLMRTVGMIGKSARCRLCR
jgi:hypothetical protein